MLKKRQIKVGRMFIHNKDNHSDNYGKTCIVTEINEYGPLVTYPNHKRRNGEDTEYRYPFHWFMRNMISAPSKDYIKFCEPDPGIAAAVMSAILSTVNGKAEVEHTFVQVGDRKHATMRCIPINTPFGNEETNMEKVVYILQIQGSNAIEITAKQYELLGGVGEDSFHSIIEVYKRGNRYFRKEEVEVTVCC